MCFFAIFRLFADNQIRLAAIKFAMNCPALTGDKEIEAETKKMEPHFAEFKATLAYGNWYFLKIVSNYLRNGF